MRREIPQPCNEPARSVERIRRSSVPWTTSRLSFMSLMEGVYRSICRQTTGMGKAFTRAKGKRQKAKGKRHKAKGKRQKAKGKRQRGQMGAGRVQVVVALRFPL